MTWKDIEMQWAAMARRVGSDQRADDGDLVLTAPPLPKPGREEQTEMRVPLPLDRPAK